MNKKRVMLISCAIILLCSCIIVGMSYALFTASVSVKNHLQAGNLEITLTRTNLEYSVLNDQGELAKTTNTERFDFTNSTEKNVFGIDSTDLLIVPGSYFDATMEITNDGTTAFNYWAIIKVLDESDENLADQLQVTITDKDGNETTQRLDEFNNSQIQIGNMKKGDQPQTFNIKVSFIESVAYNEALPEDAEQSEYMNNNLAQSKTVVFDLIVSAVQATSQS